MSDALRALVQRGDVRRLFAALGAGECRLVGGAVRDALQGRHTGDIDLAARLAPEEVCRRLEAAGIRVLPTGLAHGTVSAWVGETRFEITRLRRDEETDGRHARIAPVDGWDEDARRRDFTINAIYADAGGGLHDPLGGAADLQARRVRFIGAADERIREDYLRILRFFRFSASHGGERPDADGLAACTALQAGLTRISGERIQDELGRILRLQRGGEACAWMMQAGVLGRCLGAAPAEDGLARLQALMQAEAALNLPADACLRLAALLPGPEAAHTVAQRLRLSRACARRLGAALQETVAKPPAPAQAQALLYRFGRQGVRDMLLLAWAGSAARGEKHAQGWRRACSEIAAAAVPRLPLTGDMVMRLGVGEGEAVGAVLAQVEQRWLAGGLAGDEDWALAQARLAVAALETEAAAAPVSPQTRYPRKRRAVSPRPARPRK